MSKGSRQRPTKYDRYSESYDKIFGSKADHQSDPGDDYAYPYLCGNCGGLHRMSFYLKCELCGCDDIERNERFPLG